MSLLVQAFLILSLSFAVSDDEKLAQLMTKWDHADQTKVSELEQLFQQSRLAHVKRSAALLLAFLPEASLQGKPHEYAHYVLKNQSKIENPFSLYRIAGDGYFTSAVFKEAAGLYKQAQTLENISAQDKIYFLYKEAWAYLNLQKPQQSHALLLKALELPSSALLRQPMIVDLGQSYGEAVFSGKLSASENEWFQAKSQMEEAWFVEGLLKAYRRSPLKTALFYRLAFQKKWLNGAFPSVFEFDSISQRGPCEVMAIKKELTVEVQRDPRFFAPLNACVEKLLGDAQAKPAAFKEVSAWYESFPTEDLVQKWTLQKVYGRASDLKKSCQVAISSLATLASRPPEWMLSWLQESATVCKNSKQQDLLDAELAKNSASLLEKNLFKNLQQQQLLSETLELKLLLDGKKTWSSSVFNDFLKDHLNRLGAEKGSLLLISTCPIQTSECFAAWESLAREDFLWVRAVLDSPLTTPVESSPWRATLELRERLAKESQTLVTLPKVESSYTPLVEDVTLLQAMETYRAEVGTKSKLSDKGVFVEIEKFQQMLVENSRRKWSTKLTQKRMQTELVATTKEWQGVLKKRGKTADEKQQWKMLVQAMGAWRRQI